MMSKFSDYTVPPQWLKIMKIISFKLTRKEGYEGKRMPAGSTSSWVLCILLYEAFCEIIKDLNLHQVTLKKVPFHACFP